MILTVCIIVCSNHAWDLMKQRSALRLTAVFRANGDRGCRHKTELYLYKRRGLTIKNMCVKLLRHIKKKGDHRGRESTKGKQNGRHAREQAAAVHGGADDDLNAGPGTLQRRGQRICVENKRKRAHCGLACLPDAEPAHFVCRRIRRRYKRADEPRAW